MGTSLRPIADKYVKGTSPQRQQLPSGVPPRAPRSGGTGASGTARTASAVSLPLAESENAIIPARRSASCNSILKNRSLRIVQAAVLSDLEAGKRRAK